jgi:glycosyltransferase involved in cell wall biosynthesis
VKRRVYPWIFRIPKVFLPGGSRQAAYLREFGVPPSRIEIARMTSDVSAITAHAAAFTPTRRASILRAHGLEEDRVRILYVGRLEPHKGVADLLDAFDGLQDEIPMAQLLIAGSGGLQGLVEAAAAQSEAIRYLGHLSGERVWDAYAAADIFVLPSRSEPWGLVVNEAMAAGLPVIATDRVGCVDDLVQNGITGTVVPAESRDHLRQAMKALVVDAALRRRMGSAGVAAISSWTLDGAAANTIRAWHKVAA